MDSQEITQQTEFLYSLIDTFSRSYFGVSGEVFFFVGSPLLLLAIVFISILVVSRIRGRKEEEALRPEMDIELPAESAVPVAKKTGKPKQPAAETRPKEAERKLKETPSAGEPAEAALPKSQALVDVVRKEDRQSWLKRLQNGLSKTRTSLLGSLGDLFKGKQVLNDDLLESIHESLFRADVGVKTADRLVGGINSRLKESDEVTWDDVKSALKDEMNEVFTATEKPLRIPEKGPFVILVIGVNGVGKTTTTGKLAAHFLAQGKSVLMCAADTFRAAAIDQLQEWGRRLDVEVIAHKAGSDPAAVAYDGVKAAIARKMDVLLIDTAGRLHNKRELMDELAKINRVIGKDLEGAPHETWLVIDATTGQNAMMQTKAFCEVTQVSGLIVTKIDGTAKGGVVIGVCDQHKLPIRYIGVGEQAADLQEFSAKDYAESLFDN